MIKMITNRCWIATLISGLFLSTFYVSHRSTPIAEKTDWNGSDVSAVEIDRPAPDLNDVEEVASKLTSGSLVSVVESPDTATFTSQPIQTGYSPQLPQVSPQPAPPAAATIQKPVPPNYQAVDPSTINRPIVDEEEDKNLDVLMRGPLHEAYAEVYQYDPRPSVIINRQPPEPIAELPPAFKPDGENVEWITGYWAWDDQRNDFIWISGVWRNIPPGQRWVPGYWQVAGAGFRWVSGFWIGDQQAQVDYLPQPPASLDNGPVQPAPSDDHYYAPGNWLYQDNAYVWHSGYWAPRVAYRVWIPARYIWTPSGCIYRPGFWDYEFDQRGVLFAPVCFTVPVYRQVEYCYQPTYVINTNVDFMAHLFVRPTYCHYYFGDWYGPSYVSQSFYPWSNYGIGNLNFPAYDPLFSYYGCRSTRYNNVQALGWVQNQFSFYFQYENYRPRHTYHGQREYEHDHDRDHYGHDAVRRASYGERYDERISRQQLSEGRSGGYSKVAVSNRIDSLAVSREISRRRSSQVDRPNDDNGQRRQATLELPPTKPTSVTRASAQLPNDGRNRAQNRPEKGDIRIPDDLRRKLEGFEKQQAEKNRQRNLSTTTRNPEQKSGTQRQTANQPEPSRPQVSGALDKQPKSTAKQRRQTEQVRQQRESEQPAKDQRDSLQRATEAKSIKLRETPQRTQQATQSREAAQQIRTQRDAQQRAANEQSRKNLQGQQRAAKPPMDKNRADQQRSTEQPAQPEMAAKLRSQQQESQRREAQQLREAQQQAQQQQQAQRQRDAQQKVQQKVQQQRDAQQKVQQQRDAHRQRDAQQQAQQQREAQQRSEQLRVQRDRESQQRAEQQRTQRKQESEQRAQRDAQNRAERDADRQKNSSKGKKN